MSSEVKAQIDFLSRVGRILAESSTPATKKLSCHVGYTSREVELKHVIKASNSSDLKKDRCKRCLVTLVEGSTSRLEPGDQKRFTIRVCTICGKETKKWLVPKVPRAPRVQSPSKVKVIPGKKKNSLN